MKVNCFIIDDELHAIDVITEYVKNHEKLNLLGYATDPQEGLRKIILLKPDVIFLDVQMPILNGLEIKSLIDPNIKVIFTTGKPDFAVEAFEHSAFDYLLKPISYQRFCLCVKKIQLTDSSQASNKNDKLRPFIFVKCDNKGKMSKLILEDIKYIESDNNHITVNTEIDQYKVYLTLKEIAAALPESLFIRIHKRFIVNYDKINYIDGNRVFLNDRSVLQIGDTYRESFFSLVQNNLISTIR